MESLFDIVMREDDFVLYANGGPMISKHGNELAHSNARLLRLAVIHEMPLFGKDNTALSMLSSLVDIYAGDEKEIEINLEEALIKDSLLVNGQGNTGNIKAELMIEHSCLADFLFLNASSLSSSLNNFLLKKDENSTTNDFIKQSIQELSLEQKVALNSLFNNNNSSLIIHFLLIAGYISITEYASGLLIESLKKGDNSALNEDNYLESFLDNYTKRSQVVIDFITLSKSKNKVSVIEEIIKRGENDSTEFKSTLRWDLYQSKKNPAIEHASLKTICAFLNSNGGDLLIGVRDDGSIEGIETDKFPNDDRFLLHLWTLIKTCMGQEVTEWVKTTLQKFGNKTVCRVGCLKSKKPVFLNQKGFDEAFYVRTGPSSSNLEISSALKYIEQHFKEE